ncbi:RNA 2',3'-cyclic phosphodiesterase [Nocardioides sp. GY 10127]|uniref:RNA 2',3'-cyclic phosphodiesterase n=1 Tax=Nocardioides sp. GY 10127 TaxID=2569762 RepID=UPI0010A8B9C3|nr:RNA 2',3'-cyclic phosphodiesterase [Nocardioides sp. GY 10127]TIC82566.1 RNA 2',3'-cyclic phosphodiesterase [Nocardioides sp. GY 10127]
MRLFAALVPPPEALAHLEAFVEPRREAAAAAGLRLADPSGRHVTLAFYGEVDAGPRGSADERAESLADAVADAAARRRPPCLSLAGGGAFPDPAAAQVLWAGLAGAPDDLAELGRLATGCRHAAARAGTRVEGRAFRPHLTLARRRHPGHVDDWVRLLDGYAGPSWSPDVVTLLASVPTGHGRRYEPVADAPLG